jgi:hypothetical protein
MKTLLQLTEEEAAELVKRVEGLPNCTFVEWIEIGTRLGLKYKVQWEGFPTFVRYFFYTQSIDALGQEYLNSLK